MSVIDYNYRKILYDILENGKEYNNVRRESIRLQIPSYTFRHDFFQGFPLISTKAINFKSIVGELIWFLRGDNDIKYLNENGITIWNDDAFVYHKLHGGTYTKDMFNMVGIGSVGQNYSRQWRAFNGVEDQIATLVSNMRSDIMGSRLKVTAWNPTELDKTALPPCHDGFQIIGIPLDNGNFGFELHWNQRSTDAFLGLPFDIASYALLAKILEVMTGYKALAIEGNLKCVHLYDNQIEATKIQIERSPYEMPPCELLIKDTIEVLLRVDAFDRVQIEDFCLHNYKSFPGIPVKLLTPKIK